MGGREGLRYYCVAVGAGDKEVLIVALEYIIPGHATDTSCHKEYGPVSNPWSGLWPFHKIHIFLLNFISDVWQLKHAEHCQNIQNAAELIFQAGAVAQELCKAQARVARVRTATVLCCSVSPSPSDGSAWSTSLFSCVVWPAAGNEISDLQIEISQFAKSGELMQKLWRRGWGFLDE